MPWRNYILSSVVRRSYYMFSRKVTKNVVAVLAFKTVYTLEMKRRHNEKKVIAIYGAMKDMMGVLLWCVMIFNMSCLTDITQPQRCGKRQAHRPRRHGNPGSLEVAC